MVIEDRWASARYSKVVEGYNRQPLSALQLPFSHNFLDNTRNALFESIGIDTSLTVRPAYGKPIRRIPKIVFVNRQSSDRKLDTETHKALLGVLKKMDDDEKARVFHVRWEEMSRRSQMEMVSDADVGCHAPHVSEVRFTDARSVQIYLGVHGNGMTHQIWMPPGGKVIEVSELYSLLILRC